MVSCHVSYLIKDSHGALIASLPFKKQSSIKEIKQTTSPPALQISFSAALAVPPVASRSSTRINFPFERSGFISSESVPYSNS